MSVCRVDEEKKKLTIRLNRIEGQIRGINKMIAEDRDCIEILNQIASTQSALKGVWKEVVREHLNGCVAEAIKSDKGSRELIEELVENIDKIK